MSTQTLILCAIFSAGVCTGALIVLGVTWLMAWRHRDPRPRPNPVFDDSDREFYDEDKV